ncbi:hypothetical protein MRX96_043328 [Rhipicephalus microplus]
MNAEGPKPAQLYDLTHPRGAHSFHELLSDQELEYAVDYRGTIALRSPECVGNGNASAHMLSASTYSELRNAYETILAKATYRSISKNAAELPQLLLQNTFPGAGRWSGYWISERNPYKRSVQDMLLHNMMGLPVYGTAPCRLRDVVDARTYRACSRLAHLTAYFPVHHHAECSVTIRPHEQPWNDLRTKYHLKLKEATCSAAMLRASLLPYTFTALYQSHKAGTMLARPMFFEFPTDNGTHAFTRQFMFGPHLLVVPGTKLRASSKLVKAYFPRGVWYEPRKGHRIQSLGQTIFVPESKHSVAPFFARAGSIVPRAIAGAIRLEVFFDDDEQAAGDLFQLPPKEPELKALVANNYSLFHFFYVKGALTGHCSPCAVKTLLSCITLYGLKRRPSVVEIKGRLLPFNTTDRAKRKREAPKCRTALSPVVSAEAAVEMPSEPSSPAKDWYRSKAEESAQEVLQLKKKVKTLQQSKRRLSRRCDASENLIKELKERKLLSEKGLEVFEATFSPEIQQLLVRAHEKTNKMYPPELRAFALTLHYYSAAAYEGPLLSRAVFWGTSFTLLAVITILSVIIILPTTGEHAG